MLSTSRTSSIVGMAGAVAVKLLLATACSTTVTHDTENHDYLTGTWEGAVQTPVGDLPVSLYITEDAEGLSCVLDSPNQSNDRVPCGEIAIEDNTIHIVLPRVNASYRGILDANQLSGQWTQAGLNFHLELSRLQESPDQL